MTPILATAYCGPATPPHALASAWNADVIAALVCVALVLLHRRYGRGSGKTYLWSGVTIVLALFVSPLCALTVSLFSARVAHHVLLVAVAAPLLALAFPQRKSRPPMPLEWLVGIHALVVWFWHAPQIYAPAIQSALPYWIMQMTLLASAVFMWRAILSPRTELGTAMLAFLASIVQMGMLGALLTFAREPLYAPHFLTTLPYGLTPLADQQLAGLIMWVPAALPYLAAALILLSQRLERGAGAPSR
ncbi:cytochrome c oxidase assembly protein [Mesorhizobium sp. CAU 1741]|uniref:cytochrome c oxidase assembly protein n=1 Tax=Mesorhizobium sp. CAU 1741 TaxID=3140366 RepID=UPI00325B851B